MTNLQETTLTVPDVSCEHCVKTINKALGELSGVEAVQTDIPTKSVHFRYDPNQVSMQNIEDVLDDAGYTVSNEAAPTPRTSGKPLNLL